MEGFRNLTPTIGNFMIEVIVPLRVGSLINKEADIDLMERYFEIEEMVAQGFECPLVAEDSKKCAIIVKWAKTCGSTYCYANTEEKNVKLTFVFFSYEALGEFVKEYYNLAK